MVKKLTQEVADILNARLIDEYNAFYLYKHLSLWCKINGFEDASKYYKQESEDELSHAKKIEKFMSDWNVMPVLPVINTPYCECATLYDVIQNSYNIEYDLYEKYETDSIETLRIGDTCAFDFLQFYRNVQTKSVAEYADMLAKLEGVDATDKFKMLSLEKKLF